MPHRCVADLRCGCEVALLFGLLLARCSHNQVNLLSRNTQVIWLHAQLQPLVVRWLFRLGGACLPFPTLRTSGSLAETVLGGIGRGIPAR